MVLTFDVLYVQYPYESKADPKATSQEPGKGRRR